MSMYVVGNPFFFPTNGHLGWELDDHNYSPVGSRGVFYLEVKLIIILLIDFSENDIPISAIILYLLILRKSV